MTMQSNYNSAQFGGTGARSLGGQRLKKDHGARLSVKELYRGALFRMASGCSTGTHSHRLLRCQQCSYVTPSSSNLKRHRCLHTSECPHQCSHCGKAFVQKVHLAAHLHVHTGKRPFHCCLFPGSLTQKAGLVADLQSNTVGHSIR
ncbi:uncharacterized protein LOC144179113 [Haemaphysalis longicornis]